MKKGETYSGVITRVDFMNKGIALCENGENVIIKNTLPGQTVTFRINKKRGGRCEGRLISVDEKSPLEVRKPVCSEFPECGGCRYQTMAYEEQLSMKEAQVKRLIGDMACEDNAEWLPAAASPHEYAYRNKMEFSFGDAYKDGPMTLGLHKLGTTYDVLTAADCRIVHSDFGKILSCVLDYCTEAGLPAYKKMAHTGCLRHLLIRRSESTGEILAAIVTTSECAHDFAELCRRVLELELEGKIGGFIHIVNDALSDTVRCDEMHILYGKDYITEHILGLTFKVSLFSFFQTNTLGAEVLYKTAREFIGESAKGNVFDLYSGTGTIAQMLAPAAERVVGVEIVEEAVDAARENAALNGLTNCRFIAGDVLKVLDEIEEKPDMIVLDPPRDGIHPKALSKIIDYGVSNILYISCKPTSLQRDLVMLRGRGYRIKRIKCVDMFPQTGHVETVCCLYHQKKDFISGLYEPKDADHLKQQK